MDIIPQTDWRGPERPTTAKPFEHAPAGIEVHHTVTGRATSRGQLIAIAQAIWHDHVMVREWSDVFYGFLVGDAHTLEARGWLRRSGQLQHVTVALVGNFDVTEPNTYQLDIVRQLRHELAERGGGVDLRWHGQRAQTDCPGHYVVPYLQRMAEVPVINRPGRPPATPPTGGDYTMPATLDLRRAHEPGQLVRSPHVRTLQGLLMSWGYGPRGLTDRHGLPDGVAGAGTRSTLVTFQDEHDLAADGIAGPRTWRKLIER